MELNLQPLAAVLIIGAMATAAVSAHWGKGIWAPEGIEYPLICATIAFALAGLRLNGLQNGTQPVEQVQKPGDDGPIGDQFPIAQQAKKILARVGQLLEPLETKKSGGSLDRMYGAEDIA